MGLTTDGVLETIEWMFGGVPEWATAATGGPVGRLATTDTRVSWLVRMGRWSGTSPNTGNVYVDDPTIELVEAGEPSFEISGPAADLDRWIWGRGDRQRLTMTGNTSAFEELVQIGLQ